MSNSTQKTTLYRYFDSEGQLLYVGITGDNTKRQSQHKRNSFWFGLIASATFEHFDTRQEALEAESKAIRTEGPKHNSQQGYRVVRSPKLHMLYLCGRPDGGHDAEHFLFANLMRSGMRMFDGYYESADEVLTACMIFSDMGKTTKNVITCQDCNSAFRSEWFTQSKAKMEKLGTAPEAWVNS